MQLELTTKTNLKENLDLGKLLSFELLPRSEVLDSDQIIGVRTGGSRKRVSSQWVTTGTAQSTVVFELIEVLIIGSWALAKDTTGLWRFHSRENAVHGVIIVGGG